MADIKIRELDTGSLSNNNDYLVIATNGGDTVKIPYSALVTFLFGTSLVQGSNITITDATEQGGIKRYSISSTGTTTVDVGTTTTGAAGTNASVTNSGTTSDAVFNFTIPRGETGADGNDGASISATETAVTGGHTVTIRSTDPNVSDVSFTLTNGINGTNGTDGDDGASISFATASITGGHSVTISSTDPNVSDQTFNVMDGTEIIQTTSDNRTVTLTAAGWQGASAPYTQTVTVLGMTSSVIPTIAPSFSDTVETGLEQKSEWAKITKAVSDTDTIVFKCYEDKPAVDLTAIIKVV